MGRPYVARLAVPFKFRTQPVYCSRGQYMPHANRWLVRVRPPTGTSGAAAAQCGQVSTETGHARIAAMAPYSTWWPTSAASKLRLHIRAGSRDPTCGQLLETARRFGSRRGSDAGIGRGISAASHYRMQHETFNHRERAFALRPPATSPAVPVRIDARPLSAKKHWHGRRRATA